MRINLNKNSLIFTLLFTLWEIQVTLERLDYQARVIVLKTHRLAETDRILHLYSREHGPIRAVAKGAYKIQTEFGAKTQVLNCLDLVLAQGRNLDIVKEAGRVTNFAQINSNYLALSLAYLFVDIFDHIAVNDDHYQEPFDLLLNYLQQLNQLAKDGSEEALMIVSARYLWRLIKLLGYKPELDYCSLSHKKRLVNQIPQHFDFSNGSITSEQAYRQLIEINPYQDQVHELKPGVFKILSYFEILDALAQEPVAEQLLGQVASMHDRSRSLKNSLAFLQKHLSFMIHKEFKSWKLVDEQLNPQIAKVA